MAYTDYNDQKEYHKKWYKKNKERLKQKAHLNNKEYIKRNREFFIVIKEATPCVDCRH